MASQASGEGKEWQGCLVLVCSDVFVPFGIGIVCMYSEASLAESSDIEQANPSHP